MAWLGLDRRNFPRIEAKCDIRILEGAGKTIMTKTENLGGGGVCVVLQQELEKLSTVHLRLTVAERSRPIECDGRVAWSVRRTEPVSHKVTYDTGVEFLNLKAEDQVSLLALSRK